MSDLERIKDDFNSQRKEIVNKANKEKNAALEELQLKAEILNEEYQGCTHLNEYMEKKEKLNEEYKKTLTLIESNKLEQLESLDQQEVDFFKYLDEDQERFFDEVTIFNEDIEETVIALEDKIKMEEEITLILDEKKDTLNKIAEKRERERKHNEHLRKLEEERIRKEREDEVTKLENQYAQLNDPKSIIEYNDKMNDINYHYYDSLEYVQYEFKNNIELQDREYEKITQKYLDSIDIRVDLVKKKYDLLTQNKTSYEDDLATLQSMYKDNKEKLIEEQHLLSEKYDALSSNIYENYKQANQSNTLIYTDDLTNIKEYSKYNHRKDIEVYQKDYDLYKDTTYKSNYQKTDNQTNICSYTINGVVTDHFNNGNLIKQTLTITNNTINSPSYEDYYKKAYKRNEQQSQQPSQFQQMSYYNLLNNDYLKSLIPSYQLNNIASNQTQNNSFKPNTINYQKIDYQYKHPNNLQSLSYYNVLSTNYVKSMFNSNQLNNNSGFPYSQNINLKSIGNVNYHSKPSPLSYYNVLSSNFYSGLFNQNNMPCYYTPGGIRQGNSSLGMNNKHFPIKGDVLLSDDYYYNTRNKNQNPQSLTQNQATKQELLSHKKIRMNFAGAIDLQRIGKAVDSVRREAVHTVSHENTNTVRTAIRSYRYVKGGIAGIVTFANMNITARSVQNKGIAVLNVGRYIKGENKIQYKLVKPTDFQKQSIFGYALDSNGHFRLDNQGKKILLKGKAAEKSLKKRLSELRKKKIKGLLSAKEKTELNHIEEFFRQKYAGRKKQYFSTRLKDFVTSTFRQSNEIGVAGVANGIYFITNPYVYRTVYSFIKTGFYVGKSIIKTQARYTGKAIHLGAKAIGKENELKAATAFLKQKKTNLIIQKNKVVSQINGGLYQRAKVNILHSKLVTGLRSKVTIGIQSMKNKVLVGLSKHKRIQAFASKGKRVFKFVGKGTKFLGKGVNQVFSYTRKTVIGIGKGIHFGKVLLLKILGIGAIAFLVIFLLGGVLSMFTGVASSVILWDDGSENGTVDLSEFVEVLSEKDQAFRTKIESAVSSYDDVVYLTGFNTNNYKEIVSMAAVRYNNTLLEDEERKEEVLNYIRSLYDASHSYHIDEDYYKDNCNSVTYNCTEKGHEVYNAKGCKTRTLDSVDSIPSPKKGDTYTSNQGITYTYNGTKWINIYCPGNHKECPGHTRALVSINTLTFNQIYLADVEGNEALHNGVAGNSLGSFEITAYCSCYECCGKYSPEYTGQASKTASGTSPKEGRTIAVDRTVIPLGTHVIINGNEYIAEDVGGAIKGNRIDIYFKSHEQALQWGRRTMNVYSVKPSTTPNVEAIRSSDDWEGWTDENKQWVQNIYEQDWNELYVGWNDASISTGPGINITITGDSEIGVKAAQTAVNQLGKLYWWGAEGPQYFDCSGLVYYCLNQAGVKISREGATTYGRSGQQINIDQIQAGDVVAVGDSVGNDYEHIGIYIGDGVVVHAGGGGSSTLGNDPNAKVKIASLKQFISWFDIYSIRRLY